MSDDGRNQKFWAVRDLPEETRRQIKEYAAQQGLNTAEALEVLVRRAVQGRRELPPHTDDASKKTPTTNLTSEDIEHLTRLNADLTDAGGYTSFLEEEDIKLLVDVLLEVARRIERRVVDQLTPPLASRALWEGMRRSPSRDVDALPSESDKPNEDKRAAKNNASDK